MPKKKKKGFFKKLLLFEKKVFKKDFFFCLNSYGGDREKGGFKKFNKEIRGKKMVFKFRGAEKGPNFRGPKKQGKNFPQKK